MKFARFLVFTAICAITFSFCANSFAQSDRPAYATVVRITGEARYSEDGTTWRPLVVGHVLIAGDVVETAANGSLDLVLGKKITTHIAENPSEVAPAADTDVSGMTTYSSAASQNVIHMDSNTVLAIDKLTMGETGVDAVSDTELDLRQGTIFGNVKKLSASSQYLIKMPNGIAGIRGTTFMLSANGHVTVISGSMVVSFTNGQGQTTTTVMGPGDSYDPFTGQVTQLTPQELKHQEDRLHVTITIEYGVLSFSFYNDRTTIFISPTTGT